MMFIVLLDMLISKTFNVLILDRPNFDPEVGVPLQYTLLLLHPPMPAQVLLLLKKMEEEKFSSNLFSFPFKA